MRNPRPQVLNAGKSSKSPEPRLCGALMDCAEDTTTSIIARNSFSLVLGIAVGCANPLSQDDEPGGMTAVPIQVSARLRFRLPAGLSL